MGHVLLSQNLQNITAAVFISGRLIISQVMNTSTSTSLFDLFLVILNKLNNSGLEIICGQCRSC